MESNRVYIILAVVLVLGGGFFAYRHFQKDKNLKAHHEDTYRRMTDMAKKSPRIGMLQMGKALKTYYADKKTYPNSLDELYPDYISGRSFIDEVNWQYSASGENFFLRKSVEHNGKVMVASMDATLKTRVGTTGAMVASAGRRPPGSRRSASGRDAAKLSELKLPSGMDVLSALTTPGAETRKTEESPYIKPIRIEPRIVKVDDTESPPAFAAASSRSYLVWKSPEGHLGFGNVQYPGADRISIASQDKWFNVSKRSTWKSKADAETSAESAGSGDRWDHLVASNVGSGYVVWKQRDGTIGFGNVQYPRAEGISVASRDNWFDVPKRPVAESPADARISAESAGVDKWANLASMKVGSGYVVWKDRNGTIGFGNVQYPAGEGITHIYVDGKWEPVEKGNALQTGG